MKNDPDAVLYGTYDAMRGLPPDPGEYGWWDENAAAYERAYKDQQQQQQQTKSHSSNPVPSTKPSLEP